MNQRETERVRKIWNRTAPGYDKKLDFWERVLFKDGRAWVCSQASGSVLEIAVGTGRNLAFYPPDVRIIGIDLSEEMLALARRRAESLGLRADLRVADAQSLPFPDDSFDTVVVTLALCSIPDDARAVAEVKRVLRPGGRFVLLEHVRSPNLLVRAVQAVFNVVTVRLEGDHQLREPLDHLKAAGFLVERLERHGWGIVERAVAKKPEGA